MSKLRASLDEMCRASHGIIDVIEKEASKAREPAIKERARQAEQKAERATRGLAERAGTARLASIGARMHASRVSKYACWRNG